MHQISRDEIEAKITSLATTYSGLKNAMLEDYVGATLGIDREDAVEFYTEIERTFGVDLRPITEIAGSITMGRLERTDDDTTGRDPQLREIIDFIDKRSDSSELSRDQFSG